MTRRHGTRSIIALAALGVLVVLIPGTSNRAQAECSIQEVRGPILDCGDANTIDARDRPIPDLGPRCDPKAGEDCRPFAERLLRADLGVLDGFWERRGIIDGTGPAGEQLWIHDGNIAFREVGMADPPPKPKAPRFDPFRPLQSKAVADGYGYWLGRRLQNAKGELIAEERTITIVKAGRDGTLYFVTTPEEPRAILSEARDLETGTLSRQVWVRREGTNAEMSLTVHKTIGDKAYRAVLWTRTPAGGGVTHLFDNTGQGPTDGGVFDIPGPDALFSSAQERHDVKYRGE